MSNQYELCDWCGEPMPIDPKDTGHKNVCVDCKKKNTNTSTAE